MNCMIRKQNVKLTKVSRENFNHKMKARDWPIHYEEQIVDTYTV